jgi:hypothetical protein
MTSFRPDPDVLARRVGDELVLVHPRRNEVFSLNATGARLWELVGEGRSRSELVDQLTAEFDVSREAAEGETDRLLAQLEREGLLARGEG